MRTLVIDTATAACSVALIEDGAPIAERHTVVGRGHAEQLLPLIAALPGGGRAEAIWVDCGPGSFTGIRVGLAAARALAFAWGAALSGYAALELIAASAFAEHPDWAALAVVAEGGHGELFVQRFAAPLASLGPEQSLSPAAALAVCADLPVVGSGLAWLRRLRADIVGEERLPRAADARLLPQMATRLAPCARYGRAPDAKPMAAA